MRWVFSFVICAILLRMKGIAHITMKSIHPYSDKNPNIFWSAFEHSCKYDQLNDPNHLHLIISALRDPETNIVAHADNSTFTLYGKEEALLVVPRLVTTKLLLWMYYSIKQCTRQPLYQ